MFMENPNLGDRSRMEDWRGMYSLIISFWSFISNI